MSVAFSHSPWLIPFDLKLHSDSNLSRMNRGSWSLHGVLDRVLDLAGECGVHLSFWTWVTGCRIQTQNA